jgi:hypothetical protein
MIPSLLLADIQNTALSAFLMFSERILYLTEVANFYDEQEVPRPSDNHSECSYRCHRIWATSNGTTASGW